MHLNLPKAGNVLSSWKGSPTWQLLHAVSCFTAFFACCGVQSEPYWKPWFCFSVQLMACGEYGRGAVEESKNCPDSLNRFALETPQNAQWTSLLLVDSSLSFLSHTSISLKKINSTKEYIALLKLYAVSNEYGWAKPVMIKIIPLHFSLTEVKINIFHTSEKPV